MTPQDTPFYRALETAVKRRHPDAIVTPMMVPYGTDANGFRPRGVKSYGILPGIMPAASILSMHGDAEFMPGRRARTRHSDPVRRVEGDCDAR